MVDYISHRQAYEFSPNAFDSMNTMTLKCMNSNFMRDPQLSFYHP